MPERAAATKVPAVTLTFWVIKILATTLGETAGDTVSMTIDLGYVVGTAILLGALIVLVVAQIRTTRFHPFLYWATIIASTTAGTTMADFAHRSLGIGYPGGPILLLCCVGATGRRMRVSDMPAAHCFSARRWRSSLPHISGPASRASRCSGPRSY